MRGSSNLYHGEVCGEEARYLERSIRIEASFDPEQNRGPVGKSVAMGVPLLQTFLLVTFAPRATDCRNFRA